MTACANDIDFGSQAYLTAPWRILRKLSENSPLFWSDVLHAWVVTPHADVKAAYSDRRLSAARMDLYIRALPPGSEERYPTFFRFQRLNIAFMDAPEHLRVRVLMMKAFGRKQVDDQKPIIADVIQDILEQAALAGQFNYTELVSSQLPTRIIQGMLGVPRALTDEFFKLATDAQRPLATTMPSEEMLAQGEAAVKRLQQILSSLIRERERAPTSDILSALVAARDEGDRLSEDELFAACLAILGAGSETTGFMLGVDLVEILRRPDLQRLVENSLDDAMRVVQELLRYPGLVMGMTRIVKEPFDWHGKSLKQGEIVFMMNCTANVDPTVFNDPERIDPDRDTQAALSFGPGLHFCVGHYLARAELAAFLHAAFTRFNIELLTENPQIISSYIFRGYERLDVRFSEKRPRSA